MNSREFFFLVAEMRRVQKEYFTTRNQMAFRHARSLEDQIDREIARVKAVINQREAEAAAIF